MNPIQLNKCLTIGWILLASALTGCKDDVLESIASDGGDALHTPSILIEGEDSFYELPVTDKAIASVKANEEGFITVFDSSTIYFEQNDDGVQRNGSVELLYADGTTDTLRFCQKPFTRSTEGRQFLRNHGVGYSYNAVNGNYCNMRDFRCQILNRAMLDKVGDYEGYSFVRVDYLHEDKYTHEVFSSVTDYIQNTNVFAGVSGTIVLFSGDASASCSLFEEGVKSSYILKDEAWLDRAEYTIDADAVKTYAQDYPSLLTSSFRHAISNLNTNVDIDNFLYKYGTHVVVYSKLGARLSLEVQVDTHKFEFKENAEALAEAAIATLFKVKSQSSSQNKNYEILKEGRCRLSILGGDLKYMDEVIDLSEFTNDYASESMLDNWVKSVKYSDNDLLNSNVEMTDMEVVPIWEFIPDDLTARRVEARVTGNCALIAETLGNRNLVNTSFELGADRVTCKIGGVEKKFDNPDIVDVIVAHRHVATMCHEYVPELAGNQKIWVAYPIYEGRVDLSAGLSFYEGNAYDISWNGYRFNVDKREEIPSSKTIYMNMGMLTTQNAPNLTYQPSHYILGCERPGGVKPDGSLGGEMIATYKHFGHFYLRNNTTRYDNLPGWSWMTDIPKLEYETYKSYFPQQPSSEDGKRRPECYPYRMWRNNDYVYIYNPKEVSYE